MLPGPGNSDDGDSKQDSEKNMGQHNPYSADEKPQNIHDC